MESRFLRQKIIFKLKAIFSLFCILSEGLSEVYKIAYSLFWVFGIYTFFLSKIIEVALISFNILTVNTFNSFLTKHFLLNMMIYNIDYPTNLNINIM